MKNIENNDLKQVGNRIKERRMELGITMPALAEYLGVNRSTIQRYESDGVDQKRTMVIKSLASALETTPEWLLGLTEEREMGIDVICENELTPYIKKYLESVSEMLDESQAQLLTTLLGKLIEMYTVFCFYYTQALLDFNLVASDKGLMESLIKYAIHAKEIKGRVFKEKLKKPVEDMKKFLDGLLYLHDSGRDRVTLPDLFDMVKEAEYMKPQKINSNLSSK